MASTRAHAAGPPPSSELSTLLPILVAEITRLKQLHSLAGIAELPVKDVVVREELAQLRADFAQIKSLCGSAGATAAAAAAAANAASFSMMPTPSTLPARAKTQPPLQHTFGTNASAEDEANSKPPVRPRLNSINVSGPLALPDGCSTHFFLVSNNHPSIHILFIGNGSSASCSPTQSHFQSTGSDQVATLELELQRLGFKSW